MSAAININAKIDIVERSNVKTKWRLESDLQGEQTLEDFLKFLKKSIITIARDALKEEQSKGFDPKPLMLVDGRRDKSILDVNPFGKIQFINTLLQGAKIVSETYDLLIERSKVVTGTYIESHFVYFNGKLVATNKIELDNWLKDFKPRFKDVIRFVNVVPYARKIERMGVTAQRTRPRKTKSRDKQRRSGEFVLAPNGVYWLTYRSLSRKYKNNIGLYFNWVSGGSISNERWPTHAKNGKVFRRTFKNAARPKDRGPYVYPSIKLYFRDVGTK